MSQFQSNTFKDKTKHSVALISVLSVVVCSTDYSGMSLIFFSILLDIDT